ncbi:EthD domain-containing protein [Coniochaeta sp. 2T2.1]|nr:EthD domain-containing protein [Coniochaeta sp. 2T2.1]
MASSTAPPRPDKIVCSVSLLKRNPAMTLEEFYHHWEHIHAPLVKPWAERFKFVSYLQVHTTEAHKGGEPIGPEAPGTFVLGEYDGVAVIEAPSFEVFAAAFKDEYYVNTIEPDEWRFVDKKVGVLRARGDSKKII